MDEWQVIMGNNTILRDISTAFKLQLWNNLSELKHIDGTMYITSDNNISFNSPGEDMQGIQLSLFLYKVSENTHLRNLEPISVGSDRMRKPPLTLDLYYLITPNITDKDDELMVIERIMQSAYEMPLLDTLYFSNTLKDTGNDEIKIISNQMSIDDLNKLWSIFPNKPYKLSLSYIVSPVRIPSIDEPVSRVTEYTIGGPV